MPVMVRQELQKNDSEALAHMLVYELGTSPQVDGAETFEKEGLELELASQ